MTEHDELMDVIERARPDDLVLARTPAAHALLEEILSMQVARAPEAADMPTSAPRRSRRGLLALSGATAVLVIAVLVVGAGEPSPAASVEAALTKSSSMLERSGRIEFTLRWESWPPDVRISQLWEFSGDDSSVTTNQSLTQQLDRIGVGYNPHDCSLGPSASRHVDGEWYQRQGTCQWYRYTGEWADRQANVGFTLDPSTLLDELRPAGGFVEVATEQVDGIETTRLRASDPQQTTMPSIRVNLEGHTITSLEVWVDRDGLVRRLDLATTAGNEAGLRSISLRFFDLGEPITIEAPTDFEDVSIP